MINWFSVEVIGVILSAAGALGAFSTWVWKYAIIPCIALYKNIDNLTKSVDDIKKEVIPNGGSSIKDTVNRIDRRQVMIDKRSKAIFYNIQDAIVEVDELGSILWANEKFHKMFKTKNLSGLDWITIIDESDRQEFLDEFNSCSETNRELDFKTYSTDGEVIHFSGFPYRDNDKNYGFLIYLKGE